jgi:hypothetical protein
MFSWKKVNAHIVPVIIESGANSEEYKNTANVWVNNALI